ncbi:major yolk protein-like [Glandiceps talaboti]
MKTLLILAVCVLGCLAMPLDPYPHHPVPNEIIPTSDEIVRWCVPSECELNKCWRMAHSFTYNVHPRKTHMCMLATSEDHCLNWVENGYADVIVARDVYIWAATRAYNLKPVAYEMPEYKGKKSMQQWESISIAVVPKSSTITRLSQLKGVQSCHAGVHHMSSWLSPMCFLIHHNVMPHHGNMAESTAHYFHKSCVPGVLDKTYDVNQTHAEHLCEICGGHKEDHTWCDEKLDIYAGFHGAGLCLKEGKGQVAFLDNNHITEFKERFGTDYKLVCKTGNADLDDWTDKDCQIGYIPRPTVFIHNDRHHTYLVDIQTILTNAVIYHSENHNMDLFNSDEYMCPGNDHPHDLIFRDNTLDFETIPDDKTYIDKFLEEYDTCHYMTRKPRAKFCAVHEESYHKCMEMKRHFYRTDKVNDVSWGCTWAPSKMECMKALHNGTVDLVSLDPMETFIAGHEFHHSPFLSQYFDVFHEEKDGEKTYHWDTQTYTIGVMLKNVYHEKHGMDNDWVHLKDLNTCHAGISRVSSFHHPMGWLLSNGTIPRVGSVFESVNRYFHHSCVPGAKHWDMHHDIVLGHEFNWGYHGISFHNFTGMEWFVWNVPHTWNYYNWHHQSPSTMNTIIKNNWMENPEMMTSMMSNKDKTKTGDNTDKKTNWDNTNTDNMNVWQRFFGRMKTQVMRDTNTKTLNTPIVDFSMWTHFKQNIHTVPEFMLYNMPDIEKFMTHWQTMMHTGVVTDIDHKWMNHPVVLSFMKVYHPEITKRWINFFDNMEWLPFNENHFNRYTNPIWLSPRWEEFANNMKVHQEELCDSCQGYREHHCIEGTEEPNWGTHGSLHCIKEHRGDVAFIESHKFEPYVTDIGMNPHDFVLVCPNGHVIDYVNEDSIKECHFGRIPFPAMVTSHRHSGSWRWNVTKALLHAQKIFDVPDHNDMHWIMFGEHSVFHPHTTKLYPLHLINQTHHSWLGPMFLRSMEALIKPSHHDWWKMNPEVCHAETFTNVIHHHEGRCNAHTKEVTCMGNPHPKTMWMGRIGHKYQVTVPMCSRPSRFMRKMVEFTCDTGYGYLKPVMVATECECMPCHDMYHAPEWSHDYQWTTDNRKYDPTEWESQHFDLWGNKPWWMHRETYDNWFHDETIYPLNRDWNVNRHLWKNDDDDRNVRNTDTNTDTPVCEHRWQGKTWHHEWFPNTHHPVCNLHGNVHHDMKMMNTFNDDEDMNGYDRPEAWRQIPSWDKKPDY